MHKALKSTRLRLLPSGSQDTRRNLPARSAKKRAEANFLKKFEQAYFLRECRAPIASREFAIEGFGRADLVWLAWSRGRDGSDFSALAFRRRVQLTAIEGKLSDWRKGLQQAFRYRYFANRSLLVLPIRTAHTAAQFIDTFRRLRVGLWGFDEETGRIHKWCTPRSDKPMDVRAWEKALHLFESGLKLSQLPERG
jgi:hypothetical protein